MLLLSGHRSRSRRMDNLEQLRALHATRHQPFLRRHPQEDHLPRGMNADGSASFRRRRKARVDIGYNSIGAGGIRHHVLARQFYLQTVPHRSLERYKRKL